MSLGDKAVDGLVGVVLEGRVGQVGEDVRLVDQGTGDRVGRAGVEHAALQGRVGDAVDQSPRAHVKFVGEAQGGTHGGYDVFGRYAQRQLEVVGAFGAGGAAGAHGDEPAVGVPAGQVGHPQGPDVLDLPEGQSEVSFAVGEIAAVDDSGELVGGG